MASFLKNHPFAVEAFFNHSIVLTFAVPKEEIAALVPASLEPDTFEEKWAFIAIAMVQTTGLRPKGFPAFMGNNFFLTGYRVFVRYTNAKGKRLRGLYILKSETDKKKMQFFGNIFTHYNYTTTDITQLHDGETITLFSEKSDFHIVVDTREKDFPLPADSPFHDWKEARRFAGPLPFTFTWNPEKKEMLIIEGVRENWKPRPIQVLSQHISFIDALGLKEVHLANAFIIENIPYWWKKGVKEKWQP